MLILDASKNKRGFIAFQKICHVFNNYLNYRSHILNMSTDFEDTCSENKHRQKCPCGQLVPGKTKIIEMVTILQSQYNTAHSL